MSAAMLRRIAADIVINQRETDEESPVCGDPPSVTLKVVLIEPSSLSTLLLQQHLLILWF